MSGTPSSLQGFGRMYPYLTNRADKTGSPKTATKVAVSPQTERRVRDFLTQPPAAAPEPEAGGGSLYDQFGTAAASDTPAVGTAASEAPLAERSMASIYEQFGMAAPEAKPSARVEEYWQVVRGERPAAVLETPKAAAPEPVAPAEPPPAEEPVQYSKWKPAKEQWRNLKNTVAATSAFRAAAAAPEPEPVQYSKWKPAKEQWRNVKNAVAATSAFQAAAAEKAKAQEGDAKPLDDAELMAGLRGHTPASAKWKAASNAVTAASALQGRAGRSAAAAEGSLYYQFGVRAEGEGARGGQLTIEAPSPRVLQYMQAVNGPPPPEPLAAYDDVWEAKLARLTGEEEVPRGRKFDVMKLGTYYTDLRPGAAEAEDEDRATLEEQAGSLQFRAANKRLLRMWRKRRLAAAFYCWARCVGKLAVAQRVWRRQSPGKTRPGISAPLQHLAPLKRSPDPDARPTEEVREKVRLYETMWTPQPPRGGAAADGGAGSFYWKDPFEKTRKEAEAFHTPQFKAWARGTLHLEAGGLACQYDDPAERPRPSISPNREKAYPRIKRAQTPPPGPAAAEDGPATPASAYVAPAQLQLSARAKSAPRLRPRVRFTDEEEGGALETPGRAAGAGGGGGARFQSPDGRWRGSIQRVQSENQAVAAFRSVVRKHGGGELAEASSPPRQRWQESIRKVEAEGRVVSAFKSALKKPSGATPGPRPDHGAGAGGGGAGAPVLWEADVAPTMRAAPPPTLRPRTPSRPGPSSSTPGQPPAPPSARSTSPGGEFIAERWGVAALADSPPPAAAPSAEQPDGRGAATAPPWAQVDAETLQAVEQASPDQLKSLVLTLLAAKAGPPAPAPAPAPQAPPSTPRASEPPLGAAAGAAAAAVGAAAEGRAAAGVAESPAGRAGAGGGPHEAGGGRRGFDPAQLEAPAVQWAPYASPFHHTRPRQASTSAQLAMDQIHSRVHSLQPPREYQSFRDLSALRRAAPPSSGGPRTAAAAPPEEPSRADLDGLAVRGRDIAAAPIPAEAAPAPARPQPAEAPLAPPAAEPAQAAPQPPPAGPAEPPEREGPSRQSQGPPYRAEANGEAPSRGKTAGAVAGLAADPVAGRDSAGVAPPWLASSPPQVPPSVGDGAGVGASPSPSEEGGLLAAFGSVSPEPGSPEAAPGLPPGGGEPIAGLSSEFSQALYSLGIDRWRLEALAREEAEATAAEREAEPSEGGEVRRGGGGGERRRAHTLAAPAYSIPSSAGSML